MNRSLRHLALLGLLVLGASTAGAQVLFNLTYNPSELKLVVTPTGNTASGSLSSKVFLAEYGVLFSGFFAQDPGAYPSGILAQNYQVPTQSIANGFAAASTPSVPMNVVYSDIVNRVDLNVSSNTAGAMTFASSGASFVNSSSNPLTITFASSVNPFMRTSSFTGGAVSVFDNSTPYGNEYTIGTYNYSVVPEPSTYAAIAGALGLGYAVYRRRRQAAAAAATA
jgi:hypothetical protein